MNTAKHRGMSKPVIIAVLVVLVAAIALAMTVCFKGNDEKVLIYSSMEDYRIEYLNKRLKEQFPNYDITVEYMSTGNHAAKLLAEGTQSACDITHNLEYGYLAQLEANGTLADLSSYNKDIFTEDTVLGANYIPQERNGGAIVINTKVLADKGLSEPTSYEDLLKPEYKGLVSMPSPKASGTGYMFLKSLVNAWGENKAFGFFDKLTPNILQYTSSGSGPLNALVQGEVAIGLGMTAPTVTKINEGSTLKIIFFEEGSPYSLYGQAMINGKEKNARAKEVFDWLVNTFNYENCEKFFPEKIYKDKDYEIANYPKNIHYSDMSNNTVEEKAKLLDKWKY